MNLINYNVNIKYHIVINKNYQKMKLFKYYLNSNHLNFIMIHLNYQYI